MICQIFNFSELKVFKEFSQLYKIYREVFDTGQFGLEIRDISTELAEEIYQIILEEKEICYKRQPENDRHDLFMSGSLNQLKNLARRIISSGNEEIGYRIFNTVTNFEEYDKLKYSIGGSEFVFNRAHVMGILNVTPDSFSDGGLFYNCEDAVEQGIKMIDEGADILDVGGESTRPGSDLVKVDDEAGRVIPVIDGILKKRPGAVISVDTNKSIVAKKAISAGASIVNDISGLSFDPDMAGVIKDGNAAAVIMHIQGTPKNMQENPVYENVVKDVYDYLYNQCMYAAKTGIQNIFVDPGIGFGKTPDHNFELLRRLNDFRSLGYPILTGVSRKSFLGKLLDITVDKRDMPSAVTETAAVLKGARVIRTHNVKYGIYLSKITEKFI